MDFKIIMNDNKTIRIKSPQTLVYQGENNCDNIEILIPAFYGDIDMFNSSVLLYWVFHYDEETINNDIENRKLSGNFDQLQFALSETREGYLETKFPISIDFTAKTGEIEFWIEVKTGDEILLKTNSVTIQVNNHISITDYISDEQIDFLSSMLIQMRQLINTCNATLEKATVQADRATLAAETVIQLLEEWEATYGGTR